MNKNNMFMLIFLSTCGFFKQNLQAAHQKFSSSEFEELLREAGARETGPSEKSDPYYSTAQQIEFSRRRAALSRPENSGLSSAQRAELLRAGKPPAKAVVKTKSTGRYAPHIEAPGRTVTAKPEDILYSVPPMEKTPIEAPTVMPSQSTATFPWEGPVRFPAADADQLQGAAAADAATQDQYYPGDFFNIFADNPDLSSAQRTELLRIGAAPKGAVAATKSADRYAPHIEAPREEPVLTIHRFQGTETRIAAARLEEERTIDAINTFAFADDDFNMAVAQNAFSNASENLWIQQRIKPREYFYAYHKARLGRKIQNVGHKDLQIMKDIAAGTETSEYAFEWASYILENPTTDFDYRVALSDEEYENARRNIGLPPADPVPGPQIFRWQDYEDGGRIAGY